METGTNSRDTLLGGSLPPIGNRKLTADLDKFGITKNGFLPDCNPLSRLPDSYYGPWERIIENLPALIQSGIRDAIADLPVLSTERLGPQEEWRRAFAMLAYMSQAYIWGGDEPEKVLLPQLAIPLLRVSEYLELPPILNYAAASIWNFSCTCDDLSKPENLGTLFSFTGTESESWFLLISVATEAYSADIIWTMIRAIEAAQNCDHQIVTAALTEIQQCIQNVDALLERMLDKCDPLIFYFRLRPFLAGSKNMEAVGLPRGVFYDEGNGKGKWRQLRGPSNGQSSLIQLFDIILGIEHKEGGGEKGFHIEARDYMPAPHRRFLMHISSISSIRKMALQPPITIEQKSLRNAYTAAAKALGNLRNKHIQIVTRYIILPSKKSRGGTSQNLTSISSSCKDSMKLAGTGGTVLLPFLKKVRDETFIAGGLDIDAVGGNSDGI